MSEFRGIINKEGRPRGSQNRINKEVKNIIADIVEGKLIEVKERLDELPFKEQVNVILKLLPYVAPQLRSVETTDLTDASFRPITIKLNEL